MEEKAKTTDKLKYDPERKVTVHSIANWTTGFQRIESNGDVTIPANGSVRLNASEIISQVQNGNTLFNGIDAQGSHATLYIEDKPTRIEANFETETTTQDIVTNDVIKKLFELKTQKAFEDNIRKTIVTRSEKAFLLKVIKELKINDYTKIAFCVEYTGMKM